MKRKRVIELNHLSGTLVKTDHDLNFRPPQGGGYRAGYNNNRGGYGGHRGGYDGEGGGGYQSNYRGGS